MKYLFLISVFLPFLIGCDTSENNLSSTYPLEAVKIESVQINGSEVKVTTVYATPTPCWYYYRTESTNNDIVYTSKVYGKDDGQPCIQVIDSIARSEKIIFYSAGVKTLRFWQNDSQYLDTTITIGF